MSTVVPPSAAKVVLTGAGFSVPAGLPVAGQLIARGREQLKPEFLDALDSLATDVLGDALGEDVEAALTRLRVLELYSARDYLAEILPLELGIYYLVWASLVKPPELPSVYDSFLDHLGESVAIATLNYDLVLEAVFRRKQRLWHYTLQGESNSLNELRYAESLYASAEQNPHSVPYLKLHGSFNWHYCWRCDYFRIVPDEWFGVSGFHIPRHGREPLWVAGRGTLACAECTVTSGADKGQALLKPLIIPPSRLKEYSRAPVRRQWAFFDLLLWHAEELVIVGTSIRDEDILLRNSLSFLSFKNPGLGHVTVIDPVEEVANRVAALTGLDRVWYPDLAAYVAG